MPSRSAAARLGPGPTPAVTRDRILDVAEALFAERGLAGVSMRDLAARAGLTPASLYNHFSGKDALYESVLERGMRPLLELMREQAAREPGPDAIGTTLGAVMDHLARRPHLPRLIHHETLDGGVHLMRLGRGWIRPLLEQGLAEMERDPASPWDRDELPLAIAAWLNLILGHFSTAPLVREVLGEDPLAPAAIERQTRFLRKLAGLLHGAGRYRTSEETPQ